MSESTALHESRRWKKAVYEETKHMDSLEALEYIYRKADEVLKSSGVEAVPVGNNVYSMKKRNPLKVSKTETDYKSEK